MISMSCINILIREIRESRGLTLKEVEAHTRYSTSAINRWELGCGTVPADFLAHFFDLTRDARILNFIAPGLPIPAGPRPQAGPARDPGELNRAALEAIEQTVQSARYVQRIFEDGKVDGGDDYAIARHLAHVNRAGQLLADLSLAIIHFRERQTA